ncbi:hypothetical protein ACELLULO517_05440 [Acidisoma cellulosilytica]|uniref:DUF883 family protein n=1 Tax=Acidisoma cellulosilyticum TaxID=2802395 RepID=A0A963Z0L9_9PROT|nr:hypothetical protein [Acidisoma cellulosilyticum]MCB8879668.1 hypothetical protein [Acidisoma cellulosilyticum]
MSDFEPDPSSQAKRVSDDIASLKEDVAVLIRQMKDLAGRYSQDAADSLSDQAAGLYETVSETGRRGADTVAAHIEEKPVTSLLLAFAAGFIFSKIVSR